MQKGCKFPNLSSDKRDQVWTFKTETDILSVSISRLSPRLNFSESQCLDRVRDWIFLSLNIETEFETEII